MHIGGTEIVILAVIGLVCVGVLGGAAVVAFLLLTGSKDKSERRDAPRD